MRKKPMVKKLWQKLRPMPIMLSVLLTACSGSSQISSINSGEVKPAGFPQLPPSARQGERLPYCSPSCSANLTVQRESMQQQLTELMSQEKSVSAPTTR